MSGQQLVEHAPQGVDVGGRAGRPPEGPLRGEVGAGADDLAHPGQGGRGLVDETGDPEVADLQRAVGVQHQVSGLDVPVDHTLPVGHRQAGRGLRGDGGGTGRVEGPARGQLLGQARAPDELHDQIEAPVPGAEVVDGDHLRVIQPGRRLGLQPESARRGLVAVAVQEELHRHLTAQHLVLRLPDFAHAAAAEKLPQPVPIGNQHPYHP
ncbi:hypothetical protein AF335_10520 [Streptomyces eurocidicus]|uniref:Uncharacterized protein n=1 Tax=Streptomyces eurocidicus TaxID=66423 RepID=A0A2N8NX36_STREU|nr:hypothetical protein AF335_10520 [Streptomyces eurocidicus]